MQKRRLFSMIIGLVMILGATACSDYRRAIRTERSTPDEFQVVVRPPLSLPPEFTKRPDATTTDLGVDEKSSRNLTNNLFERRNITAYEDDEVFDLSATESLIRLIVY